jgi:hypothetical protein
MFAFAYSQAAAGVRVDNGTGFSPKRGTNRGQYCGRFTSSGSLTMLAAMRRASLRNRAFCLSSAQRSTTISGEPCPKKSSASFAHLAAPERAVRSEPLPRCCTLCHVPDGLARRSYLHKFYHRQRPQRRWLRVVVLPPETVSGHPAAFSFDASLPTVCRANENNKGDTNGGRSRRSDLRVPQMPRDGYASFQRRIGRRRRLLNRHPQRKKGLAIKRGRTSASHQAHQRRARVVAILDIA